MEWIKRKLMLLTAPWFLEWCARYQETLIFEAHTKNYCDLNLNDNMRILNKLSDGIRFFLKSTIKLQDSKT